MSFTKHCDYKDSGIAWLGRIPMHWDVSQSRRLFALRNERANPDDEQLTASQDHGVIPQKVFMELEGRRVVQVILNAEILKHVEPGDFVISMRSFQGGIEHATHRGCISSAYVMLIPSPKVHGPFFKYLLKSQTYIQALQSTTNLVRDGQALRYQNFTMVDLPLVPLDEQKAIASFLDVETSKIDGLVSEQRRLIELLKEKRQAVISHAVTKGLNPNAPMKPSGIQWLGDVPEHWSVLPLKRVGSIRYGIGEPPKYHDDGTPLIRATNVRSGVLTPVGLVFVEPDEIPEQRIVWLHAGDIIVVRSGAGTGDSAIIPKGYGPAIAGFDMVLSLYGANAWFIQFVLLSKYVREGQIDVEKMRAAQPHLNAEELGHCDIVLPPEDEQAAIVEYLSSQTQRFDTLQAEAERAIELLQERRTALISAAVTGKIDVRSLGKKGALS